MKRNRELKVHSYINLLASNEPENQFLGISRASSSHASIYLHCNFKSPFCSTQVAVEHAAEVKNIAGYLSRDSGDDS